MSVTEAWDGGAAHLQHRDQWAVGTPPAIRVLSRPPIMCPNAPVFLPPETAYTRGHKRTAFYSLLETVSSCCTYEGIPVTCDRACQDAGLLPTNSPALGFTSVQRLVIPAIRCRAPESTPCRPSISPRASGRDEFQWAAASYQALRDPLASSGLVREHRQRANRSRGANRQAVVRADRG